MKFSRSSRQSRPIPALKSSMHPDPGDVNGIGMVLLPHRAPDSKFLDSRCRNGMAHFNAVDGAVTSLPAHVVRSLRRVCCKQRIVTVAIPNVLLLSVCAIAGCDQNCLSEVGTEIVDACEQPPVHVFQIDQITPVVDATLDVCQ